MNPSPLRLLRVVLILLGLSRAQSLPDFSKADSEALNFLTELVMGQLMKEAMVPLGGRGGGSADMAQGGVSAGSVEPAKVEDVLRKIAAGPGPAIEP